jgi:hypothetical protein
MAFSAEAHTCRLAFGTPTHRCQGFALFSSAKGFLALGLPTSSSTVPELYRRQKDDGNMKNTLSDMQAYRIEYEIVRTLEYNGSCSLDQLVDALSGFSWNQVFAAVDSMSRDGRLRLVHPHRFGIQISLQKRTFAAYRQAV